MKALKLLHVLLEYDYPQVFVGIDAVGGRYVCMVSEIIDFEPSFLCVPVSKQRCDDLCSARIDLRQVYAAPEIAEFYTATPSDLTKPFEISYEQMDRVPDHLLPDSGLTFQHDDEVLNKAQELNSTVAYASLSVPEAASEPRIRTHKLSAFLALYQSVLRHLSRSAATAEGRPIPKDEDPYESDVFGFCYGSFTVQIRSAEPCDILGENKALVSALFKLNVFLELSDDPEKAINFLQSVKGHAASSLIKLLEFISDNNCPLTNRWSTPGMMLSNKGRIRVKSAQRIVQQCRQREDLGTEMVELEGIVDSADVTAGTWKILVGDTSFSGGTKEGAEVQLAGVVLRNRYRFFCEERMEVILGSGKEKRTLSLTKFEPVSSN